jgi:hypothetical protein
VKINYNKLDLYHDDGYLDKGMVGQDVGDIKEMKVETTEVDVESDSDSDFEPKHYQEEQQE